MDPWSIQGDSPPAFLESEAAEREAEVRLLAALRRHRFPPGAPRRCPRCRSPRTIRWGRFGARQRYRCHGCRRTFSDLTATPLAYTKHPARWIAFGRCMLEGHSVRRTAAHVGVDKDTAFRWRHRLAAAYDRRPDAPRSGPAALVPTRLPFSEKGRRPQGRPPRRRRGRLVGRSEGRLVCILTLHWADPVPWQFAVLPTDRFVPNRSEVTRALEPLLEPQASVAIETGTGAGELAAAVAHLGHIPLRVARGVWRPWRSSTATAPSTPSVPVWGPPPSQGSADPTSAPNPDLPAAARDLVGQWRFWLRRFRGVATRYLRSYLAWFRELPSDSDMQRRTHTTREPVASQARPLESMPGIQLLLAGLP